MALAEPALCVPQSITGSGPRGGQCWPRGHPGALHVPTRPPGLAALTLAPDRGSAAQPPLAGCWGLPAHQGAGREWAAGGVQPPSASVGPSLESRPGPRGWSAAHWCRRRQAVRTEKPGRGRPLRDVEGAIHCPVTVSWRLRDGRTRGCGFLPLAVPPVLTLRGSSWRRLSASAACCSRPPLRGVATRPPCWRGPVIHLPP